MPELCRKVLVRLPFKRDRIHRDTPRPFETKRDMTVQELIDQLKSLDPDKNIWIIYDSFIEYEPDFLSVADEKLAGRNRIWGVKPGDYIQEVG